MGEWIKFLISGIIGLISGVIATLLGFLLSFFLEIYKEKKETENKKNQLFQLVKEELKENKEIIKSNIVQLNIELESLEKGKHLIHTLAILKNGLWDILKYNYNINFISKGLCRNAPNF